MSSSNNKKGDEDLLPGFRFHPTDEELVGFYLRRKVEKRSLRIEIIKQIDIYRYDPWDIPRVSDVADKEWYFFCRRGRKYRNSMRPNRVTGSGFWKATGIDRPIYSTGDSTHGCIGLKKSLVYYRGSAGKGTKTDWMMHEFRLPATKITHHLPDSKYATEEAEIWTICRIFKRDSSVRKTPYKQSMMTRISSKPSSSSSNNRSSECNKISGFSTTSEDNYKPVDDDIHHLFLAPYTSYANQNEYEFYREESWDELRPMVDLALDPTLQNHSK